MSAYALSTSSSLATATTAVKAFTVNQPPYVGGATTKTTNAATQTKLRLVKAEDDTAKSDWKKYLEEDAQGLLRVLQRMVNAHPLARAVWQRHAATLGASLLFSPQDITHDIYLLLLQKDRFRHYLASGMTDAEIEREIFQIEMTNYLIGILRRYRPENYRMARRIGNVLESDARFKPMREQGQAARYRQSAEAVYGLAEWDCAKAAQAGYSSTAALAQVATRKRDLRRVGCSGDTQVIVSNQELAALLAEILQALDAPAPLRVLRQLALSKLPVWDVTLTPIETDADDERLGGVRAERLTSAEANPEEQLMHHEEAQRARCAAQTFLARLHASTKENAVRTERLWRVLWHCYFDPTEPSQLAIAEMVGVSDSSVGDYRRRLESEMRRLSLSFAQVTHFSEALRAELRKRLFGALAGKEGFQRRTVRSEIEARALPPLCVVPQNRPSRLDYAAAT